MNTTTYAKAFSDGDISLEVLVYESEELLITQKGIVKLSSQILEAGNKNLHTTQCNPGGTNRSGIILKNLGDDYFIFRDMFGKLSRFFRAYVHNTLECKVRVLPNGYAYTHKEIVFTRRRQALLCHNVQRKHPFGPSLPNASKLRRLADLVRLIGNWFQFYLHVPFAKKYNSSVALLTREIAFHHYGHFLKEMLAGYYQLRLAQKKPDFYILPLEMPFHRQVYELLNIDLSRIIPSHTCKLIRARELIIPTLVADYERVEYRSGYSHTNTHILPLFTYTMHRELFSNAFYSAQNIKPYRKIYLARPEGSNRNFINHEEIESVMIEYGFEIVVPDFLDVVDQMRMMSEAEYVVSMHGAGLNNLFFAREHTKVLEIFSQYYHDHGVQFVALAKQCDYHYIIAETPDISMHPQQECAYLYPQVLRSALDTLIGLA